MKNIFKKAILLMIAATLSAQTISNINARQEGLEIIITYDMAGELTEGEELMLKVSLDGGKSYQTLTDAEGDIGSNVKPGTGKTIYWLVSDEMGGKDAVFNVGNMKDFTPPGMVYVKGGTFHMGSNDGGSDEKPVHTVTVSDFFMDATEVTQAQYRKVMGNNPSYFSGCDNCPVENVSWNDANEYARKAGKRLPTEAEWEWAARGGVKTNGRSSQNRYAGSNNIDEVAWYYDNSGRKTHPVGQKQPNELGLYDMSGNVWEWCSDWYGDYPSAAQTNPQGPNSGSFRVLRGGSWNYGCRVAYRLRSLPDLRLYYSGFRLVSRD